MKDIYMIDDGHSIAPAPLVIWYGDPPKATATAEIIIPKLLIIKGFVTFPYKSNQTVPQKYEGEVTSNLARGFMETKGIMSSGRYYTLEQSIGPSRLKNRGKTIKKDELVQTPPKKNKPVIEKEAFEFLRIMKYSESNIME